MITRFLSRLRERRDAAARESFERRQEEWMQFWAAMHEAMPKPTRHCRYEAGQVPESELRVDSKWGLIHDPEGFPVHTILGEELPQ